MALSLSEQAYDSNHVRGILHTPERPDGDALALTHGAGSDCNAALLVTLARAFCEAGMIVLRYDLPFRVARAGGAPHPSMQARDREGVAQAIAAARGMASRRVFAGGHSYGGRQTAMLASEHPDAADGLLL